MGFNGIVNKSVRSPLLPPPIAASPETSGRTVSAQAVAGSSSKLDWTVPLSDLALPQIHFSLYILFVNKLKDSSIKGNCKDSS